jgi:hypothetical protein
MKLFCRVENDDGDVVGLIAISEADDDGATAVSVFSQHGSRESVYWAPRSRDWLAHLKAALKAVR